MAHTDSGSSASSPDNSTAYLRFSSTTLVFSFIDSIPFQLLNVDLGEYSTNFIFPSGPITFVGHKTDGATVTREIMVDGIIDGTGPLVDFQTFTFGDEFSDLSYVEVLDNTYSVDNMFLSPVPEPTTILLIGFGALTLRKSKFSNRKG